MIEYLTLEELLEIHKQMIQRFGGLSGVRDKNLLHSVIELPCSTMFGEDLYPSLFDKAAVYLFSIVRNHPFNDGNKRSGGAAAYIFLKANRVRVEFSDEQYEKLIVAIAKGDRTKEDIIQFFEKGI